MRARRAKKAKVETDRDNPIWTKRDFQDAVHFPKGTNIWDAAGALRKARGPQRAPIKIAISIRLEPKIVKHFKSSGAGWKARMEAVLKKAVPR